YTQDPEKCTAIISCSAHYNRCFSLKSSGVTLKGCINSADCFDSISCCKKDLCNSGVPTGPSVLLLLLSSAVLTIFF
uniref:UPAR/Ly6 domain-containing protein n=1 Tax=Kryptolebias marmoratus TaxID=37003 RepID=A0A3Q3ENI1_KRYMA